MTDLLHGKILAGGIPPLGLGTWGMGGRAAHDPENDDARDVQALAAGLDLGLTHIDTAELYGAGHAEKLVAQAIAGRPRAGLFLASKVMPEHLSYDGTLRACEGSLARLGIDCLDLYYVHARNKEIPFEETARAMNALLRDGRIKRVGVSNFTVASMKAFQAHLDVPLAANQSHYNLVFREPERAGLLAHCQAVGAAFVAYRPVLWRYPERENQPKGSAWERGIYPLLDALADRYGKPSVQVAMNWLLGQPGVGVLVKAAQVAHLKELLGCLAWDLAPDDIEILRAQFPEQRDVSNTVPLA